MTDREKVTEAFDEAKELVWRDDDEYTVGYNNGLEAGKNIALAMLKEQKAIEPKKENDGNPEPCTSWWYVCGDCGRYIDPHDRFCRHCGREVKWDE